MRNIIKLKIFIMNNKFVYDIKKYSINISYINDRQ